MAKNVATVEDFHRLKNELGLVPMSFLVPTITEVVGDIRGAEPYTALRWYNDGLAQPVGKLNAKPAQSQAETDPDAERRGTIAIPDAWREEHYLQRVALAKKINGTDAKLSTEEADDIIAAEVMRRSSGGAAGPNAVTSQRTVTA